MKFLNLIIIFSAILTSCTDSLFDDSDNLSKNLDLTYTTIYSDWYHFETIQQKNIVIRSIEEQNAFLNSITIVNDINVFNGVDYSKEMVIGILMQSQSSGSNSIEITSLKENSGKIYVSSNLNIPFIGNCAIGHPGHFIKLKKYYNEVIFNDTKITQQSDIINLQRNWKVKSFKDKDGIEYNSYVEIPKFNASFDLSQLRINFEETNLSGKSMCNNFQGEYNLSNSNIFIKIVTTTEAFCLMSDDFQNALIASSEFEFIGENLILHCNDELMSEITFEPTSNENDIKNWVLSEYYDRNDKKFTHYLNYNSEVITPNLSMFSLKIEGTELSGKSACNSYTGRLNVGDNLFDFEIFGMTKAACPLTTEFVNSIRIGRILEQTNNALIIESDDYMKKMIFNLK